MKLFHKLIKIKGNNNQIISPKSKSNQLYKRSPIDICGDDNLINIDECNSIYKFHLIIHGSGNVINIGRNVGGILKLVVTGNNCQIQIGQNCTFRGCEMTAFENNSNLVIGNDCIIARDTRIYASDFHTIYDCATKQPLNRGTHVRIGNHVWLGEAAMILKNNTIADNVIIRMGSYCDDSVVAQTCEVGPYARLRPGADLRVKAKVGNFSEVKKSVIGEGSKVNHLTYIGDTDMGAGVNIGAGTITCNYDGVKKHRTVIGDHCFVGSNTNFVAPVDVKPYSKIGAGSTITKEVPEGSLAIARARQVVLENKGVKHD